MREAYNLLYTRIYEHETGDRVANKLATFGGPPDVVGPNRQPRLVGVVPKTDKPRASLHVIRQGDPPVTVVPS